MGKVIKISGKVLSAIILLLIILPLSLSLLLDIPSVQNFAVTRAARFASQRLGTRVNIGQINIEFFNRVTVDDFYVEDFQGDTLLYVSHVKALVASLGLVGEPLTLRDGEVGSTCLYMRERLVEGQEVMNIKQVVDSISPRRGKGRFRMVVKDASVEDFRMIIEQLTHRNPEYGIDYYNIDLRDARASVENLAIRGARVEGDVVHLSAREAGGFVLDSLAGRFGVEAGKIDFADMSIAAPHSRLDINSLTLNGAGWSSYKYFIDSVAIDALVRRSVLSTSDLAYFVPAVRKYDLTLDSFSATMQGTVSDFRAVLPSAHLAGGGTLKADLHIKGLPDTGRMRIDGDLDAEASTSRIESLAADIAGAALPERVRQMMHEARYASLACRYNGSLEKFRTRGSLATDCGAVRFDALLDLRGRGVGVNGSASTVSFDAGRLIGMDMLGRTSMVATVGGVFGGGATKADVTADIASLHAGSYDYRDIRAEAAIGEGVYSGNVVSKDENMAFDLFAVADMTSGEPAYNVILGLHHADLSAVGINRRDSLSTLHADVSADIRGSFPDALNGEINIDDAHYLYGDSRQVTADRIGVNIRTNDNSRYVELSSDFFDMALFSRYGYSDIFDCLRGVFYDYAPELYPSDFDPKSRNVAAVAEDFSVLAFRAKDLNPLLDAVVSDLQVAEGTSALLRFDPESNRFSLNAASDYVERRNMLATSLTLNIDNNRDSILLDMRTGDLYAGMFHLPHLNMDGSLRDNTLALAAHFADTVDKASGDIALRARLERGDDNARRVNLTIPRSVLRDGDKTWNIEASDIAVDSSRIVIDDFRVYNREQLLSLEGVASHSRSDSVTLRLRNFDISPFTRVVERMGYGVKGVSNGFASAKSVLRGSEITAAMRFDSVSVNGIEAPSLLLDSRWDFEQNRARFVIAEREAQRDTLIRGFYEPSSVRYYARLDVDSLDLSLLDPVMTGVMSRTHGVASAGLTLQGQRREAAMRGGIHVRDMRTTIDFTQVEYRVPQADIHVEDNRFVLDTVSVFDPEGNRANLSLNLSLQHLSNISYDVRLTPHRMLVMNTSAQDNDFFYGKVYASGRAVITGDKGGVKMDIAATTDDDTHFYLPLSGKSNISYADFVTFESGNKPDTSNYLVRKKLMFERRQRQKISSAAGLDINLALDVRPNAEFQLVINPTVGDIIRGRGAGALNMHINPRANIMEMYGDYTISEGSYLFTLQNIVNKRFIIENGSSISWTGEPLDAMLDITAVYKLKTSLQPLLEGSTTYDISSRTVPVECIIHLSDRLTNPSVDFGVEVPNADSDVRILVDKALSTPESRSQQFLYLLIANSFISESASNAASGLGSTASAATGFELLSNQLSNWLSADDYSIIVRYRPRNDVVGSGDELDLGFATGLIDNRLLIEVEGNYLIDNATVNTNRMSNFVGEAYVTWLIDKEGHIKLRGFTQTIDRFDENQGLQETGVGIYYKEEFDNLKDLRQRIKARVAARRRERAEEQRLEAEKRTERKTNRKGKKKNAAQDTVPDAVSDTEPDAVSDTVPDAASDTVPDAAAAE